MLKFFRHDFTGWQELGMDRHSQMADPQFVNPKQYKFQLRRGSPAWKLGFREIDTTKVGLYGEAKWASQVRHRDCVLSK